MACGDLHPGMILFRIVVRHQRFVKSLNYIQKVKENNDCATKTRSSTEPPMAIDPTCHSKIIPAAIVYLNYLLYFEIKSTFHERTRLYTRHC
jgi:hypothetical protein